MTLTKNVCSWCGGTYGPNEFFDHIKGAKHMASLAKPGAKAKPKKVRI